MDVGSNTTVSIGCCHLCDRLALQSRIRASAAGQGVTGGRQLRAQRNQKLKRITSGRAADLVVRAAFRQGRFRTGREGAKGACYGSVIASGDEIRPVIEDHADWTMRHRAARPANAAMAISAAVAIISTSCRQVWSRSRLRSLVMPVLGRQFACQLPWHGECSVTRRNGVRGRGEVSNRSTKALQGRTAASR